MFESRRKRVDDVGAADDVEGRPLPAHAVARQREGAVLLVAAHVPHLEQAIGRIEEDAVAEHHRRWTRWSPGQLGVRIVAFPVALGYQHGAGGVIRRLVEAPEETRVFDQEIVDEQLPADVDVDHRRRIEQVIRAGERIGELCPPWRPRRRQDDAVVERFARGDRGLQRGRRKREAGGLDEVSSRDASRRCEPPATYTNPEIHLNCDAPQGDRGVQEKDPPDLFTPCRTPPLAGVVSSV